MSSLSDFDLSQNMSLQVLEITAETVDCALKNDSPGTPPLLQLALLTIRSPQFSRIVFLYTEHDFPGVITERRSEWPHLREMSQAEREEEALNHHNQFELLREMHKVQNFQLVLRANVWDSVGEYALQVLREAAAAERTNRWSDGSLFEPPVTYNPHWTLRYGAFPW